MEEILLTNGTDTFTFTKLGDLEGFEYPTTRPVVEDISGPQSSIYITSKFGRRRLSWRSVISSDVFANRRLLLQAARQQGVLKTITFSTCDDLDLQAEIEIVRVLMPYKNGSSIVLVEAVAPDWRFYSQDLHTNDSDAAEQTIENAGNEVTNPTFRIFGPFTSVTVNNLSNSQSFTVDEVIADGEYIDIDTLARTIVKDDGTPIYNSFEGDFISLEPSDNVLELSFVGGGGNSSLMTSWRDAYNGI